jgi:hypothetical protein
VTVTSGHRLAIDLTWEKLSVECGHLKAALPLAVTIRGQVRVLLLAKISMVMSMWVVMAAYTNERTKIGRKIAGKVGNPLIEHLPESLIALALTTRGTIAPLTRTTHHDSVVSSGVEPIIAEEAAEVVLEVYREGVGNNT